MRARVAVLPCYLRLPVQKHDASTIMPRIAPAAAMPLTPAAREWERFAGELGGACCRETEPGCANCTAAQNGGKALRALSRAAGRLHDAAAAGGAGSLRQALPQQRNEPWSTGSQGARQVPASGAAPLAAWMATNAHGSPH